jgi:hypothetical protein
VVAILVRAMNVKDPDIEWLLCQMPALMGETSGHQAIVAALEGGAAGGSASSAGAESTCERARPHVPRARRLLGVWAMLGTEHRRVLRAHYTAPVSRRPGVDVHLGPLASVGLLNPATRSKLEAACSHATDPRNARLIGEARRAAQRAVVDAHRAWRGAFQKAMLTWMSG